jgi:hypothetical protein
MTSVTVELPTGLYQQAMQLARATQRPIEQIVSDWIQPPLLAIPDVEDALTGLEELSTNELIEIARSQTSRHEADRLQALLDAQQRRALTHTERAEANRLVEREDFLTLRKAKAIYLLKQRKALPREIAALIV